MESKGVVSESNPLIQKDFPAIRGWTVLIFLPVFMALLVPTVWLARDYGTLAVITAVFAAGLVAVLAVVAPIGWTAFAALCVRPVSAPLVEELIFRGLLYGWLAGRWGTIVAWIVSSLAFAAAHFEPAHIVLVLPLGLWFGWLRRRTDSLWPSLVSHMINNGIAIAAAAYLDI